MVASPGEHLARVHRHDVGRGRLALVDQPHALVLVLVEFALDVAVGRAEDQVRSVVVILHGGRESAALGQLFLAETAPQDVVAGAEDVDVVVQVHPIDGVSPELMGNWLLLMVIQSFSVIVAALCQP